jgi:hypothetical protein
MNPGRQEKTGGFSHEIFAHCALVSAGAGCHTRSPLIASGRFYQR